jgi:hypothetical protein
MPSARLGFLPSPKVAMTLNGIVTKLKGGHGTEAVEPPLSGGGTATKLLKAR